MRRLALVLFLATVLVATVAATALAHELQVLGPGPAELDAGTAVPARLVHATLLEPSDALRVTVAASAAPVEAILLVPDREPERDRVAGAGPTMRADDDPAVSASPGDELRDEATGFGYREVGRITIPRGDGRTTIVVARGSEPTRVALRLGAPDAPFTSTDPDRTPRTLILARGWAETEPTGAGDLPGPDRSDPDRTVAWFGLGLAGAGLLVAAWWVARGRSTSRRRGVDRAAEAAEARADELPVETPPTS